MYRVNARKYIGRVHSACPLLKLIPSPFSSLPWFSFPLLLSRCYPFNLLSPCFPVTPVPLSPGSPFPNVQLFSRPFHFPVSISPLLLFSLFPFPSPLVPTFPMFPLLPSSTCSLLPLFLFPFPGLGTWRNYKWSIKGGWIVLRWVACDTLNITKGL